MTTEEDFQRALDADPTNHVLRTIFADWLQDHGDERAEGYRALGALRAQPCHYRSEAIHKEDRRDITATLQGKFWWCTSSDERFSPHRLPGEWEARCHDYYDSRLQAEDAAALAFLKLPESRRRELLAGAQLEVA